MTATTNLFLLATRMKLRFESVRGELTTEQLWDLKLEGKRDGFDLNTVAQTVDADIQKHTASRFVPGDKPNPALELAQIKMEVVKAVIETIYDEQQAKAKGAARAAERKRLTELLAQKELADEQSLTRDQILAKIAALGSDEGEDAAAAE